jgi:dTDP-L-rhamnose 4-epimerase
MAMMTLPLNGSGDSVMTTGKTMLITGGAGFIGSRLAIALAARHRVRIFDNFAAQAHPAPAATRIALARAGVRVITGDMRDPAALGAALSDTRPDVILHLAAETGTGQSFSQPAHYVQVNVLGTAHLAEAVRRHAPGLQRLVLASTRAVYGEGACIDESGQRAQAVPRRSDDMALGRFGLLGREGQPLVPVPSDADCPAAPASIYAATKLMQEHLLRQAFWGSATQVGVLRLQNVYGPGQSLDNPYTGVLSIFCRQILEGQRLSIYEDGQITRDFVMIDDVVRAFVMMVEAPAMPQVTLDIGSGQGITLLEVARRLLTCLGASRDMLQVTGAFRPGDIRHAVADIGKARAQLGWAPRVPLDAGLMALARWSGRQLRQPAARASA